MNPTQVFCPGGSDSQTGVATRERYPTVSISNCGKIPDVPPLLPMQPGPYIIPIWNSHQGEVKAAEYVWDHIEKANIHITDAWAQPIEFWFVRKAGQATNYQKIGSVVVASTQCSAFLEGRNAKLDPCDLTTTAFDKYRAGAEWDGVLVAPGQGKDDLAYEVVATSTANPNNFTSFVRFVAARTAAANVVGARSFLTGVTMPAFGASLGDAEQSFFEELVAMITNLANIPRLIFVFRRTSKVGLLFEGEQLRVADLVDAEELESGNIAVHEQVGATERCYGDELSTLCARSFPALVGSDFVLHRGKSTCLFTCAPLGLFTHGYEAETVEPVIRFYISKLFQLWDDGVPCAPEQQRFFERHRAAWEEKQSEFIQFKLVSAT